MLLRRLQLSPEAVVEAVEGEAGEVEAAIEATEAVPVAVKVKTPTKIVKTTVRAVVRTRPGLGVPSIRIFQPEHGQGARCIIDGGVAHFSVQIP